MLTGAPRHSPDSLLAFGEHKSITGVQPGAQARIQNIPSSWMKRVDLMTEYDDQIKPLACNRGINIPFAESGLINNYYSSLISTLTGA